MRKSVSWAVAAFVVGSVFLAPAPAQVVFSDKHLEAEILRQIPGGQYRNEPLTGDDLGRLTVLRARDRGIVDLRGIEQCRNLVRLDLGGNQISDLSPLEGLAALESLDLSGNKIDDLAPLSRLTRLKYLDLSRNQISDLAPLANLAGLSVLELADNHIEEITPLSSLRNLWSLDLSGNRIADISPLRPLESLFSLDLEKNRIHDVSPLRRLRALKTLSLDHNEITDIGVLIPNSQGEGAAGARYWSITIRGNPLTESSLGQLRALQERAWDVEFDDPAVAGQLAGPSDGS